MTLDELTSTLVDAVAGGEIGSPVSLRVHWQVPACERGAGGLVCGLLPMAERVLGGRPHRLMAQKGGEADQLSVLFEFPGGQTCLVTCGCGAVERVSLHLLLFGNRGQVRLEGGELLDAGLPDFAAVDNRWNTLIEDSLEAGTAVEFDSNTFQS